MEMSQHRASRILWLFLLFALPLAAQEKLRVIIETDAGGDPDGRSICRTIFARGWIGA